MFEPPEVHHERLFVISVLGFIVNLIGIFVFQHGGDHHGHSHGGGSSHGHSHSSGSSHSHDHGHEHSHSAGNGYLHGHSHDEPEEEPENKIFQGIFLHILADTMGSVGVIISSLLIRFFGWHIADPICSIIIATLISISVIPLLRDTTGVLMQRQPKSLDKKLPDVYRKVILIEFEKNNFLIYVSNLFKIQQIPGVLSVQSPHFWTLCSEKFVGGIKIEVSFNCDPRYVSMTARSLLSRVSLRLNFRLK